MSNYYPSFGNLNAGSSGVNGGSVVIINSSNTNVQNTQASLAFMVADMWDVSGQYTGIDSNVYGNSTINPLIRNGGYGISGNDNSDVRISAVVDTQTDSLPRGVACVFSVAGNILQPPTEAMRITSSGNVNIKGNLSVVSGHILTPTSSITIGNCSPINQGDNTILIGTESGTNNQTGNSIAIGWDVGVGSPTTSGVGFSSIVIGGQTDVSSNFSTSIGSYNTHVNSHNSVIIGSYSTAENAGNSIAIGSYASCLSGNSICINASGNKLMNKGPGSCVIAPIRTVTAVTTVVDLPIYYNSNTYELVRCSGDTPVKYSSNSDNNNFCLFFSSSSSTNSQTAPLRIVSGVSVNPSQKILNFAIGNITSTTNNNSTNYNSGALQVAGGAGIAGNLFIGGNVIINNPIISKNIQLPTTTEIGNIISVDGAVFTSNPTLTNNFFNAFSTGKVTIDVAGVWLLNWNVVVDGTSIAPGNVFFGISTNSTPTIPTIGISKFSIGECDSFSPAFAINGSYTVFSSSSQDYYLYGNVRHGSSTLKGNISSYFNALRIA